MEGLDDLLTIYLGDAFLEEQDEVDAVAGSEEPRTLAEIAEAEQEFSTESGTSAESCTRTART